MTPKDALAATAAYLKELEKAKRMTLKVGLPSDKVGGKVYGNGVNIMQVGAAHEYGTAKMPARSFLRMPSEVKGKELGLTIQQQFERVLDGKSNTEDALGRVGVTAVNFSKEAFRSNGFGRWEALAPATIESKIKKGKTTPLIETGLLRNSITWSVEND